MRSRLHSLPGWKQGAPALLCPEELRCVLKQLGWDVKIGLTHCLKSSFFWIVSDLLPQSAWGEGELERRCSNMLQQEKILEISWTQSSQWIYN